VKEKRIIPSDAQRSVKGENYAKPYIGAVVKDIRISNEGSVYLVFECGRVFGLLPDGNLGLGYEGRK
jgi:hypothetical protein